MRALATFTSISMICVATLYGCNEGDPASPGIKNGNDSRADLEMTGDGGALATSSAGGDVGSGGDGGTNESGTGTGADAAGCPGSVSPPSLSGPTWDAVYTNFLGPGTPGHCSDNGCHGGGTTNGGWTAGPDKDTFLAAWVKRGLVSATDPAHSLILNPATSPLVWFNAGGSMPRDARSANAAGEAAIAAWLASPPPVSSCVPGPTDAGPKADAGAITTACTNGRESLTLIVTGTQGVRVTTDVLDVAGGTSGAACYVPGYKIVMRTTSGQANWTGATCKDGNTGTSRCEVNQAASAMTIVSELL